MHNLGAFTRRYRDCGMRDVGREVGLFGDGSQEGPADGLAAGSATPSAVVTVREQSLALKGALDRLSDDYRRVIRLRYDDSLTFEQIGQEMGRSPEAARKLWARAMDCLRRSGGATHEGAEPDLMLKIASDGLVIRPFREGRIANPPHVGIE